MKLNLEQPIKQEIDVHEDIFSPDATNSRAVGRLGSRVNNIGLALMRLDYVGKDGLFFKNGMCVKGFAPEWWPRPTIKS
jgi:hypothetical protein